MPININNKKSVQEIYNEMMRTIDSDRTMSTTDYARCRKVYNACCEFLAKNHLLNAGVSTDSFGSVISMEAFDDDTPVENAGVDELVDEVTEDNAVETETGDAEPAIDVGPDGPEKEETKEEVKKAIAVFLAKVKACAGNNTAFLHHHFSHGGQDQALSQAIANSVNTVYAPSLAAMANNIGIPSQEAFGANIDKVLPDVRASMTVTLLQFHRGLIDRIMHRRTSTSPYVKYVVPYAEVYDMLKSNDEDHNVRDWGDHIIPFIELYGDPKAVTNLLQPIIPLEANDTEDVVFADGYIKFGPRANLFDLSVLPNQLGKTHYNYTDLVSENVIVKSVVVEVTKGEKKELIEIPVDKVTGARLQMTPNVNDSGVRQCMFTYTVRFDKNTKTNTGATSEIFAACTDTDIIRVTITDATSINLKRSDVQGIGSVSWKAYSVTGAEVDPAVSALADEIGMNLVAYSVDAKYSEENLRKSNLAIRNHIRTFDFEISNGRNILVDYSFEEELPEFLMSLVTEATSLGQDHRGIDVIIRELLHVYDVTNEENADPNFRERLDKIGFQYVSSQLVRPVVYLGTIDLANVDSVRSSDVLGDIRQYVEWELLNYISLIYQNSFYKHQLNAGEKPMFKVFTSSVILENIFSIPHIHNHLNTESPVDGSSVEYRRVLPNGTILDCVTCTFNYMRDKIVMIPYRENAPEDILNFGHNWDYGTFVAHYNPQLDNAVNKRVFSNTRSMVIPTNPMGLYLDVHHFDEFINMFQVTNPTSSRLPQPSELNVDKKGA